MRLLDPTHAAAPSVMQIPLVIVCHHYDRMSGWICNFTPKEERLSDLRLEQAVEAGADVLATSCPYCVLNFEDSCVTSGREIAIKDVTEIVGELT